MMKKRWTGCAAAALTAGLAFGTVGTTYAATMTLAGYGADQETAASNVQVVNEEETAAATEAQQETTAETAAAETTAETAAAETTAETAAAQTTAETAAAQTEAQTEASIVNTTAFAKSDEPISVYASGDNEGEVRGTLNKNDAVEVLEVDEFGWAKIRSGNLEGYAPAYKLATGAEAEAVADSAAYKYAKVGVEYLNLRSDPSEDSEVVDTVDQSADLEIVEDCGDWLKVCRSDGTYGYVSSEFVSQETAYSTGETVQEQSEREEQEYIEYVAQQESEYYEYLAEQELNQAAEAAQTAPVYTEVAATEPAYTETVSAASAQGDVDALYQAYLQAHEASLTATDEADAQAKAQASIDAYNAYLAACESTSTVTYTETPQATAATTDTTAQTEAAYTETTTQTASQGDVDALYQAYLQAHEASLTATDEADAQAKAQASIDAYNAYLAACGSSETVSYTETTQTTTAGTDTTTQTEAPQTEAPQTEAPAAVSSGSSTGAAAASYACQFVGNPYVYGGTSLTNGADCSGFTMAVYANFGISLPHNAAAQSGCGTSVSTSDLQPGDLVFYGDGGIGHVAIYIGNGTVVHASNEETGIKYSAYNYRTPVAAVRVC